MTAVREHVEATPSILARPLWRPLSRAVMLVFAGILVVSSIKLLMEGPEDEHDSSALEGNMVLRIANWMMDSVDYYDGEKFFTLVRESASGASILFFCLWLRGVSAFFLCAVCRLRVIFVLFSQSSSESAP